MFNGSFVALVTPFKNGALDEKNLRELVEFNIKNKTSGLVPCGSTGESATLTHKEHHRVVEIVVEQTRGRIPVIAGAGSNSTQEAISLTRHAKECGADAALVIVPYYNKPTQAGINAHFSAVAQNVSLPIIVYNIPGRTAVNMLPSTLLHLARKHKNIIGVKESSGNLDQISEIAEGVKDRKNFVIFSGDDSLTLPILAIGGQGVISVMANIVPKDVQNLCNLFFKGDLPRARELHLKMFPLIKALFAETSPGPVKAAMQMMGLCSSEMRLPLCSISHQNRKILSQAMKRYGVRKVR